jgi:hypothetical protein
MKEQALQWLSESIIKCFNDNAPPLVDEQGISNDSFNTPMFVTGPKQRTIDDYVKLNDKLENDTKSVSGIDDMFNWIASCDKIAVFSEIDLVHAFLQLLIRECDQLLTAFTIDGVRYVFLCAQLGIKIIPSFFQQIIHSILQEYDYLDFARTHIDNVCVVSGSVKQHVIHLNKILDALTSKALTINYEKCHLFQVQMPFLGMILTTTDIKPNLSKICNMNTWIQLKNLKQLGSVLGIFSFFCRFVPHYTEMVLPLLAVKDEHILWSDIYKKAYMKLYDALMSSDVLL